MTYDATAQSSQPNTSTQSTFRLNSSRHQESELMQVRLNDNEKGLFDQDL